MKSIRLSLILYFLVLLGVALAAVSWLVYQATYQSLVETKATSQRLLQAKQASNRELLLAQYQNACREEHAKLDDALESQARTLAALTKAQSQWTRSPLVEAMSRSGLLTAGLNSSGVASIPVWVYEASWGHLSWQMYHSLVGTRIEFNEDDLPRYAEGQVAEYFQINTEMGITWRSKSLGDRAFPFDPDQLRSASVQLWQFDEFDMKPGQTV